MGFRLQSPSTPEIVTANEVRSRRRLRAGWRSINKLGRPMQHLIYVVDIGSPRAGLAWARLQSDVDAMPTGGSNLSRLATRIACDISAGASVAIGFEAPGFIPVPTDVAMLGKARTGEVREGTSRPWSHGAGAYVTTMAIQIGA